MVQYCIVPYCKSNAFTPVISFHSIPQDKRLRKLWILKMKRDEKRNVKVSSTMRVCSKHFLPEDFILSKNGKRKYLRKGAVPCIFNFDSHGESKQKKKKALLDTDTSSVDINQHMNMVDDLSPSSSFLEMNVQQHINVADAELLLSLTSPQVYVCGMCDENFATTENLRNHIKYNHLARQPQELTVEHHSETEERFLQDHSVLESAFNVTTEGLSSKAVPDDNAENLERKILVLQAKIDYLEKCLKEVTDERDVLKQAVDSHKCSASEENFSKLRKKDKLLRYYTGFDNKNVYLGFLDFINPENKFCFSSKISVENQIFLVLMKLRQGFDYLDFAARFDLHEKTVSKIFSNWINVMYSRLGYLSIWPDRQTILSTSPEAFKEKFPNTILILDCTELKIECPSDLVKQSQSYSSYKSHNTLKGLIGSSPAGSIVFISQLYTGSISDKKLTEACGLYDVIKQKLEIGHILQGDSVMVDKGFAIKEELQSLGLNINVPPMGSELQFSAEDVQETRKIASCRVNVERAIRKIKSFKILNGVIPIKMMPHINQIWTVSGILANFQCITKSKLDNSILSDDDALDSSILFNESI